MVHSHSCFYAEKNSTAYIFPIAKLFPFVWKNDFILYTDTSRRPVTL